MKSQAQKFWEVLEESGQTADEARTAYWDALCAKGVAIPVTSLQSYRFPDGSSVSFGTDADGDTETVFVETDPAVSE